MEKKSEGERVEAQGVWLPSVFTTLKFNPYASFSRQILEDACLLE